GFRERHSPYVTDMHQCEVLSEPVDSLIDPLSELVSRLSIRRRLPQIEVAVADNATELVFRVLDPPSAEDVRILKEFGTAHGLRIALQPKGPDTVYPVEGHGEDDPLIYRLPDFDLEIAFKATDFVQVNGRINEAMVTRAIDLLDVQASHRVLDLFCGIGNFTLPLARRAAHVVGMEGEERQVLRAQQNAERNGIANVEFQASDLAEIEGDEAWLTERWDRLLLDPARSGAAAVVEQMERLAPARIVYVSCHPGTLARDAGQLVATHGYTLDAAGIIDMFPHTAHVESIAVFTRDGQG
ncbi:MAG: 23S rRNA (uracil(1939)-C(5))-methyltransferase RlmD, partial [Pseudomonadota bacterium]